MTQGIKNLEPEPTDRTIASYMDHASLGSFQKSMIALAALAVLFDGFDQQAISFTIPSIMREFGVERAAFAPVVALGLTGMTIGSACAGIIGDRIGRRFTIIVTMLIFGILTSLTAMVHTVPQLATMRFLAGLGLGGVLPSAAAYAAEFSSLRHRASVVTIAIVCIPLGGMLGGVVAGSVLPALGWRGLLYHRRRGARGLCVHPDDLDARDAALPRGARPPRRGGRRAATPHGARGGAWQPLRRRRQQDRRSSRRLPRPVSARPEAGNLRVVLLVLCVVDLGEHGV